MRIKCVYVALKGAGQFAILFSTIFLFVHIQDYLISVILMQSSIFRSNLLQHYEFSCHVDIESNNHLFYVINIFWHLFKSTLEIRSKTSERKFLKDLFDSYNPFYWKFVQNQLTEKTTCMCQRAFLV